MTTFATLRPLAAAISLALAVGTFVPLTNASADSAHLPAIAPGPLNQALSTLAQEAGVTLSYTPQQVSGKQTAGAPAGSSLESALAILLQGSGLVARRQGEGYVIALDDSTASSIELQPMQVEGRLPASAFAPVSGYHAERASSASKTDTPILETAQSVSVVTAEQIADRKAGSVEDAVAYVAGVRVGDSGLDPRYDQIYVRGFETTIAADFLDGLRQPNTGWLSYFSTEPYNLERIEVLKGPASVLYGQISPGGLVNRISKRPSLEAVNEVQVQAGSDEHRQGQFDVGGKLDQQGDLLYRVVGVVRDSQTSIEQVDDNVTLLAPTLSWQLDPDTKLTLISQYQERQTAGSPRPYQAGETLTDFWPGDEYFDKLHQRQWTLGYEFEHQLSDSVSLQQNLRYGRVDTTNQYLSASDSGDGHTLNRTSYGVYEDMDSLTTDTRLVSHFDTGALSHTLLTGLDYARLDYSVIYASGVAPSIDMNAPDYHQAVAKPDTIGSDLDGVEHRSGLYVQDQIELERWRFSAGLRQDWVNARTLNNLSDTRDKTHDDATTGQVGVLYLFDNGIAPYASYAQSFLPQSGTNVQGEAYKPTEGEQYEVGVKYQPPGSATLLTASLYHLTQSNVLTSDPDDLLNQLQTGEQVSRGLELEAVSDLSDRLRLTASYSFNDAEVTRSNDGNEGKEPKNVPRHLASAWLDYRLPMGIGLSGGARYVGSTYADAENSNQNDAYTLVDAAIHYDFGGSLDGVRLALNASNLLDKRYITCLDGYCYRGEARSLVTSLSYRW